MVKCEVPIRLFGERAGEYERGKTYPDDDLAALHPDNFKLVRPVEASDEAAEGPDTTEKRRKK